MLISKIRTGVKAPWAKILLGFFFIALFGGFGIVQVVRKLISGNGDGVALVNGQEISRAFFKQKEQEAQERISMLYRRFGQATPMVMAMQGISLDPQKTALDSCINATLLDQLVKNIPVYLSQEYLKNKFQDPIFLVTKLMHVMPPDVVTSQGRINMDAFQRFMMSYNLGPIEQELVSSLKQEMALKLIGDAFWLPQFVEKEIIAHHNVQKKYTIMTLSLDDMIKREQEKGASLEEIQQFYTQENQINKRYSIPAKRNGIKWIFEPQNFTVKVTDKEIENYYNKVKISKFIETPTQVKIREIILDDVKNVGLKELRNQIEQLHAEFIAHPEKFAQQEKSKVVDFFKRGDKKEKAIEQAAFRLKENGAISSVIELENGYALIQRIDRKESTFKPLEKVKAEVQKIVRDKKFATEFSKMATRMIRMSSEDPKAFEQFIESNKAQQEKVAAVAKDEGPVAGRLFSLKKRGDKIAYVSDGKGVILELGDILKPATPPFDIMKPVIEKDFYAIRAQKSLADQLKLEKEKVLQSNVVTASSGSKIEKTDWIGPKDEEKLKKLFEKGIPQDILLLDIKGGVVATMGKKDGYIIRLDDERVLSDTKTEADKNKLEYELNKQLHELFQRAFVASLYRTATIKIGDLQANHKQYQGDDLL